MKPSREWLTFNRAGIMLVTFVLSCAIGWGLPTYVTLFASLEKKLEDFWLANVTPAQPQDDKIVVVTVTEETLALFPYRSPIDRAFLADMFAALDKKQPAAIGIDLLFDQATEPDKDRALKETLETMATPVFSAYATEAEGLTEAQVGYLDGYLENVSKALVNLMSDPVDGTVRWIFPGGASAGLPMPGFVPALSRAVGGPGLNAPETILFRKGPDAETPPFKSFPAHTVALLPDAWIAGKVVLIGVDLPLVDRHRIATSPFDESAGIVPGVVVHAHALSQLLGNARPPERSTLIEIAAVVAVAVFGIALAFIPVSSTGKIAIFGVFVILYWGFSYGVLNSAWTLMPKVGPTLAMAISFPMTLSLLADRLKEQRRFIESAFSLYVPSAVVSELIERPEKLSLGGERREVTSLFTDLEGFTTLIEQHPPALTVPMLNEYLDNMCRIALENGGTIDKIIGDALCVLFGAPLDQDDHAQRAVSCALDMRAYARQYAAECAAEGVPFGKTRIGVNSGSAVVGNFGGNTFFDYTAHGDTINTAARLEGANKFFGTDICVAESAVAYCTGIRFRNIGDIVLKGKSGGVPVFEPFAGSDDHLAAYEKAFALLDKDPPAAARAFADLAAAQPDDPLVRYHAERLADGETGTAVVLKGK